MINTCSAKEVLEKHGPGLAHERSGGFQFPLAFGFLIVGCRSEQQISANNAGEALGNPGVTLGRNLDCFINGGEGNFRVAIQSIGICQIGQNAGFIFQAGLSRSREAEGVGQIVDG